jgi:hypothetical protein
MKHVIARRAESQESLSERTGKPDEVFYGSGNLGEREKHNEIGGLMQ